MKEKICEKINSLDSTKRKVLSKVVACLILILILTIFFVVLWALDRNAITLSEPYGLTTSSATTLSGGQVIECKKTNLVNNTVVSYSWDDGDKIVFENGLFLNGAKITAPSAPGIHKLTIIVDYKFLPDYSVSYYYNVENS